jgi:hypothetical protein
MKCFVMPVIIGATGIVSKSFQKYLGTIPGQHSIDSLQKTAILGTSHIIRKVLQAVTWSLSGGVHHWLKRRSTREERKPVTRNYDMMMMMMIIIIIIIMAHNCNINWSHRLFMSVRFQVLTLSMNMTAFCDMAPFHRCILPPSSGWWWRQ